MASKIFVSYRRDDDPGFTRDLVERLQSELSADNVVMDVEGRIAPEDNFVNALKEHVAQCDVLLAVIGPRWADLLAARADDAKDVVTIEIKTALDQSKRVIPVLVGGAECPQSLPDNLLALANRDPVTLRPERFSADCRALARSLKGGEPAAAHAGKEQKRQDISNWKSWPRWSWALAAVVVLCAGLLMAALMYGPIGQSQNAVTSTDP
jgi:hypothetical protein